MEIIKNKKLASLFAKVEYNKIREMLVRETDTVMGKELAENLDVTDSLNEAQRRLDETEEALAVSASCDISFGGVRDIRAAVKRAALGASLEPRQLLSVFDTLGAARRLRKIITDLPAEFNAPILKGLTTALTVLKNIENAVDAAITEQATVKDSASEELARIRRNIKQTQSRLKEKIESISRNQEYQKFFQDTIVTIRNDRYVIPVKQEYRNNFPGIVHDQSASGATLFIEPLAVLNLNNDLNQMLLAEKNEIERILARLSVQIAQSEEPILENGEIMAALDLIFAKAKLALHMQAVKPILSDKGQINLVAARHPLLEKTKVVPIDVRLGLDFEILLITGPNTGGKTVALKTVGLFALMVKAGLFIPASPDSVMPVIKNIFADIGDEQSIEQSLSTFSAHMSNIVSILEEALPGDLVLIDEIGAGTDPDEGAALAMAIIENLMSRQIKVMATTHYSELKTFAYTKPGIENASAEFDLKTLSPTYRLLIGIPGGSNAFAISRRLGLNLSIVTRAKEFLNKEHADFEAVLASLEEQKRSYALNLAEIEKTQNQLKNQKENLAVEQIQLTEKKNSVIINAKEEAAAILRQTKRETEELIKSLKEQFSEKDERTRQNNIETARRRLKEAWEKSDAFGEIQEETEIGLEEIIPEKLKKGALVYIAALKQKGEVLAVNQETITVQLGMMKTNVLSSDCRLIAGNKSAQEAGALAGGKYFAAGKARNDSANFAQIAPRQIDIRGLTIEEAEIELEKYIDAALLSGLGEILIIHGKGTGALRKGVKQYLKNHSRVKENQIAEMNAGGYGATVAKLI